MAMIGRPLIVLGPYGHWLLGHQTRSGIQTSIENFVSVMEARDWCNKHRIPFRVDLDGTVLTERQINIMTACGMEPSRMAAVAAAAKTSIAAVRKQSEALQKKGLMNLAPNIERQRIGDRHVHLTATGAKVLENATHAR